MRITLLGTKGIAANYGGFETFYENLGPRLADRGHQVWVYNRPHVVGHRDPRTYRVVNLVHLLFDASTRVTASRRTCAPRQSTEWANTILGRTLPLCTSNCSRA